MPPFISKDVLKVKLYALTRSTIHSNVGLMKHPLLVYYAKMFLLELMCSSCDNSVTASDAKREIQKLIKEGEYDLDDCIIRATSDIQNSSNEVTGTTGYAMKHGQSLLDTLANCTLKHGLQQISCYKKVMANDVYPVKLTLLQAIEASRDGHLQAISIRNVANDCIDTTLRGYQIQVAQILSKALSC